MKSRIMHGNCEVCGVWANMNFLNGVLLCWRCFNQALIQKIAVESKHDPNVKIIK